METERDSERGRWTGGEGGDGQIRSEIVCERVRKSKIEKDAR